MAEVSIDITAQDNASGVLGGIGTAFGNLGSIVSGIRDAFDLLAGAFSAVVDFGAQFVNEATESQNAIANLEATLQSMGNVTGLSSQQLQDMAGALQQVTMFSDETIINGEAMLLTFGNIGGDVFPQATEAMLDLAAKFGSVDLASKMLGKALNEPIEGISALRRVGVQLSDEQEQQIKDFMAVNDYASAQGIILAELERQVGGLAQAYGETFAGKLEILKNRLGEVKETIGTALLPILSDLMDFVIGFMPTLEEFGDKFADVLYALEVGLSEGNWDFFYSALERLDSFVADIFQNIANAIDTWLAGGGAEELSNKLIAWIDDVGTNSGFQSKALTAARNILQALGAAFRTVDWSGILNAMDTAFSNAISGYDWTGAGDSFGAMIADQFKAGVNDSGTKSDIVSALAKGISDWFLAAAGVANWDEFKRVFFGIIKQFIIDPVATWFRENWAKILFPAVVIPMEWGANLRAQFFEAARDAIAGFVAGMNSIEVNMTNWVRDHIVNPIKQFLGIASPSTVFAQIGRDIVMGLISGFSSMTGSLFSLINGIIDDILALIDPIIDFISGGATGGASGDATGTVGGGGSGSGSGTGSGGTVVNQYFAGATINVGSWDQIAYDCIYPNPFVAATSGQLGTTGGGAATGNPPR